MSMSLEEKLSILQGADRESKDAVCPFYAKESYTRIVCEGFAEGSSTTQWFESYKKKNAFQSVHCNSITGYKKCPYYRMLAIMYERGEK